MPFVFAVLTDTHVRAETNDAQAGYPSDRSANARCRRMVEIVRLRSPAFTVHLGDVTHAVPGLPGEADYHAAARAIFAGLRLYVAPGNHDVGDKVDALVNAPPVTEGSGALFERNWGPRWQAFDHEGVRFVLIDAQLVGSGLPDEGRQRAWLEAVLPGAPRVFLFLHAPPFLVSPDEPSHYDNLAEPGRAWLLGLCARHRVEAVFAGHAHVFFTSRIGETDFHVVPSATFVRPEYAELFPVVPGEENGRFDPDKVGFFFVHVEERGHRIELVRGSDPRPEPPAPSTLGAWLSCPWAREVDLPVGDLDPFRRKRARDDHAVLALIEQGFAWVRVPEGDLALYPDRVALLRARGMRIVAFSVGPPREWAPDRADLWEVIVPRGSVPDLSGPGPHALSTVDSGPNEGGYFSHFPDQGYLPAGPLPEDIPPSVTHLAFRVREPGLEVALAVEAAGKRGRRAICHVLLPRGDERRPGTDDHEVARRAVEAAAAAVAFPDAIVLLDTLADKDRGYFPRHGLYDRRWNPRLAALGVRSYHFTIPAQAAPAPAGGAAPGRPKM